MQSGLCASTKAEQIRAAIQTRLVEAFDASIEDIDLYQERVAKECSIFPEANLFPYILPALAYGNLSLKDPSYSNKGSQAMAGLIHCAIAAIEKELTGTANSTILRLKSYNSRATELGQINLALALYKRVGGDDGKLLSIHNHLNKLISVALQQNKGKPLFSYPNYIWPFDTIPCIVSLLLNDPYSKDYRKIADEHLTWIEQQGLHASTKLPYGEMTRKVPRGCDLSLRLPLIHHFAPQQARIYYDRYSEHHWAGMGFREWPVGIDGGVDIDSGPIIFDIGLSATGNGLAAILAFKDSGKEDVLMGLLAQRDLWVSLYHNKPSVREIVTTQFEAHFVPIDTKYFTGFLYGDAALFYMLTWEDYALSTKAAD